MDVGSLYDVVRHYTHQPTTTTTTEADVDEALAELYDAFYPNDDHPAAPDKPNPQPIQQVSSFADLIDQHPPPSPPNAAASIVLEERRRQEEIYRLTWHSIEARQQLMLWENKYIEQQQTLQQLQRVNHLLVHRQPLGRTNNGGRTRKRKRTEKKNQKSVYMVSAANLAVMDEWAWRKYGRKPVKGSSFLRSYYKCTSAIECKAKKQVEKCLVEPEIYLVSYTGEHTHPDPVQRTEPDGSEISDQTGGFPVHDNIVPYEAVEVPSSPPLAPPPPPTPAVADSLLPEVAAPMQVPPMPGGETAVLMPNTMMSAEDWFSGMQEPGSLDGWMDFGYDGSGSGSTYEPGFYN